MHILHISHICIKHLSDICSIKALIPAAKKSVRRSCLDRKTLTPIFSLLESIPCTSETNA